MILLSIFRVGVLVATAMALSRYVLPRLFHQIARRPELMLVGALAWCFLIGEIAEYLRSVARDGSAGRRRVAVDIPVRARRHGEGHERCAISSSRCSSWRSGMTIPFPSLSVIGLALIIAAFTVVSRVVTTFTPLYVMRQGLRASLLPAINLAQISEFSLVLIQFGVAANHITTQTANAVSFAFVVLAVLSTFVMMRSDRLRARVIGPLKRIGIRDLDHVHSAEAGQKRGGHGETRRIVILGFFRAASALFAEIERQDQSLLEQISVIDFNPLVFRTLTDRGLHVIYGDISNVDTLVHAGIGKAEIIILSVPDSLLVGASNEKLVRHVRTLNPTAKIVATADFLSDVKDLYEAGADYVTVTRISDAQELFTVIEAADAGLLEDKRAEMDTQLAERREVLP